MYDPRATPEIRQKAARAALLLRKLEASKNKKPR
jgi:hypothetical protein